MADHGVIWRKSIRILHLSDLWIGLRPITWENVLDKAALTRAEREVADESPSLGSGGYDYIVLSGNVLKPGQASSRSEVARLLEPLLSPLLTKPRESEKRLMFVPGPADPWSLEDVEIRPMEDLTLVGAGFWISDEGRRTSELRRLRSSLEKAVETMSREQKEYVRSTPTLLITSGALVLGERVPTSVRRGIASAFRELQMTLHLFGKGPVTSYGPEPLGYPYVSIGTGQPSSPPDAKLRMNSLTLTLEGARPSSWRDYSSWHRATVRTLRWSRSGGWECFPYIKNHFDAFFQAGVSTAMRTPTHRSVVDQIEREIAGPGKVRCFYVSGFPGSGRREFFEELTLSPDCRCSIHRVKAEWPAPDVLGPEEAKAEAERIVDSKIKDLAPGGDSEKRLLVMFDAGLRGLSEGPDSLTEFRKSLLHSLGRLACSQENIFIVYLAQRLEDDPLEGYGLGDEWTELKLMPLVDAGEFERLVGQFSRVVPLDRDRLRRWSGSHAGFATLIMKKTADNFRHELLANGQREVSNRLAADLMDEVLESNEVMARSREFFACFGPEKRRIVHTLIAGLCRLAGARERGENETDTESDLITSLSKRAAKDFSSRTALRRILKRLTSYGVLKRVDERFELTYGPAAPFLLADRLEIFRTYRVMFAYLSPYEGLARELGKKVEDLAFDFGLVLEPREFPKDSHARWEDEMLGAAREVDIFVGVCDPSWNQHRHFRNELNSYLDSRPYEKALVIPVPIGCELQHLRGELHNWTPVNYSEPTQTADEILGHIQRFSDDQDEKLPSLANLTARAGEQVKMNV